MFIDSAKWKANLMLRPPTSSKKIRFVNHTFHMNFFFLFEIMFCLLSNVISLGSCFRMQPASLTDLLISFVHEWAKSCQLWNKLYSNLLKTSNPHIKKCIYQYSGIQHFRSFLCFHYKRVNSINLSYICSLCFTGLSNRLGLRPEWEHRIIAGSEKQLSSQYIIQLNIHTYYLYYISTGFSNRLRLRPEREHRLFAGVRILGRWTEHARRHRRTLRAIGARLWTQTDVRVRSGCYRSRYGLK